MSRMTGREWRDRGLAALLCLGVAGAAHAQDRDAVVDYCLAQPQACAISVLHLTDGWEAHLNPDRPQPLASAKKVLPLIAYAQAVAAGEVSPDDTLTLEEWGSLQTLDGGALKSSWEHLGKPDEITLDELARVMIQFSDNAAPDWFLRILGKRVETARRKTVKGFFDAPAPISAMFATWFGAAGEPGSGNRFVKDYSGFGVDGYQDEVAAASKAMEKTAFAEQVREGLCVTAPWDRAACDPPVPALTEANMRTLERRFFTRSTARTMATLYRGLLDGSLLSPAEQTILDRHLEVWLDVFPTLSPAFSRYGLKGGSLATGSGLEVLTWAHHMQTGSGHRVVVVVLLQRMLDTKNPPTSGDINAFAQQMALDLAFARSVRDDLEPDDERAQLSGSVLNVKFRGGKKIVMKGRVDNTSPNPTGGRVQVSVYVSDDDELDAGDTLVDTKSLPPLKGYRGKKFKVQTVVPGSAGKLLLLVIDEDGDLDEQHAGDNVTWQRLR